MLFPFGKKAQFEHDLLSHSPLFSHFGTPSKTRTVGGGGEGCNHTTSGQLSSQWTSLCTSEFILGDFAIPTNM